jgi:methylglyoxal synthase
MIGVYEASTPVTALTTLQFCHPEVSDSQHHPFLHPLGVHRTALKARMCPTTVYMCSLAIEATCSGPLGTCRQCKQVCPTTVYMCSLAIEATCSGPLGTCRQYKQAIVTGTSWWLIGEVPHYSLHVCSLAIEATCSGPLGTCRQYKQAILRDMSWRRVGEWRYSSIVLKVGTRWKEVVSFTPRPLYSQGKGPWYPSVAGKVGLRTGLDAVEKIQTSCPCLESNPGRLTRRCTNSAIVVFHSTFVFV